MLMAYTAAVGLFRLLEHHARAWYGFGTRHQVVVALSKKYARPAPCILLHTRNDAQSYLLERPYLSAQTKRQARSMLSHIRSTLFFAPGARSKFSRRSSDNPQIKVRLCANLHTLRHCCLEAVPPYQLPTMALTLTSSSSSTSMVPIRVSLKAAVQIRHAAQPARLGKPRVCCALPSGPLGNNRPAETHAVSNS